MTPQEIQTVREALKKAAFYVTMDVIPEAIAILDAAQTEQDTPCCGEFATCTQACTPRGEWKAAQAAPVAQPDQKDAGTLEALKEIKRTLEEANDMRGGPINDTIWYSDHETLFDYIDAAIAAQKGAEQ